MRSARAKVVDGKIVTRAKFPDGTKLVLLVDDSEPVVELDEEDEAAIKRARASIRAGRTISMDRLMKLIDA
jgi:predicted sugar kinase